jgi:hypothetical protein
MNSPEAARKLQHVAQCTKQLGLRLRWWGRLEVRLTELVSLRSSLPFSLPFDRDLVPSFALALWRSSRMFGAAWQSSAEKAKILPQFKS